MPGADTAPPADCRSLTPLTPLTRMRRSAARPAAHTASLGHRDTALARPGPAPCVWRWATVLRARQKETRQAIATDALGHAARAGRPKKAMAARG